jgi:nucleoside-diphosphate-sugar epimerase
VGGAENIIYGLEKHGINRLVFTSTVSVYGLNSGESHENSPINPFNDYGKSKYQSETIFTDWVNAGKERDLFIVRPTVVFGPGNVGNVSILLKQLRSRQFVMVGNGKNKKSMAYVENITKFLTMLTENPPESGLNIYNYADKPDFKMDELIKAVRNGLGNNHNSVLRLPYKLGLFGGYVFDFISLISGRSFPISSIRIKKFCADTIVRADKLKKINIRPTYSLTEGIQKTLDHKPDQSAHGTLYENGRS